MIMFENIMKFFKNFNKKEDKVSTSKDAAKERLHLVLMQDRANFSADFLEMMKQEIIDVIKKYIDVDENAIDVRLTNKENGDGTNGAPALYANIPILNIKNDVRKMDTKVETPKIGNESEKKEEDNKSDKVKDEHEKNIDVKKENVIDNKTVDSEIKKEEIIDDIQVEVKEDLKEEEKNTKEEVITDDNTGKEDENTAKDEVKSEN